ncbi:hypothetical protein F4821DRAFT_254322 [Hypoxylon rubiginosum]|uniref:Uncharacterized protein n=1 Tax=Hypoxylon rubiginosum TaxID=110542 RepID=A0ACC0DJ36_9PEZI|nr:hypothetical protein F4821DRAFT_254322 [Hypoxylon rubiginosum]
MSNMKPTAEPSRSGKRKGTRSVSTLTPSQLARKRANDREAQRAIRARTKEHIDSLEREIEELRSQQNRDQTIQNLLRRNKALEDELHRRDSLGLRTTDTNDHYQPVFQSSSPPRPSPFGPSVSMYPLMTNVASYGSVHDNTDAWPTSMPRSVPSSASSPSSSEVNDDFSGNNYFSTSAPSTVMERSSIPRNMHSSPVSCISGDGGFDDVKPDFGCQPINMMPVSSNYNYQPWGMYSMQQCQTQVPLEQSHQMSSVGRCTF